MQNQQSKKPDNVEEVLADMTARGLSQYQMACELGVQRLTVRKWLKDHGFILHCHKSYVRVGR